MAEEKVSLRSTFTTQVEEDPSGCKTDAEVESHVSCISNDRRRAVRFQLQVPLFIRGRDSHDDRVMELAKTLDISAVGAHVACPISINLGQIVILTIPAPSFTSNALVPAAMQPIQARITRRQAAGDLQLMGLEFLTPLG